MPDTMDSLEVQKAFYETIRKELEASSFGKWAVVSNERPVRGRSASINPTAMPPKSRSS